MGLLFVEAALNYYTIREVQECDILKAVTYLYLYNNSLGHITAL